MNDAKDSILLTELETELMAVFVQNKIWDDEWIASLLIRLANKLES